MRSKRNERPNYCYRRLVSPGEEEVWVELEKQKDIDGYERLLQMEMEEVEATGVELSTELYLGPWYEDLTEVRQAWAESTGEPTGRFHGVPGHVVMVLKCMTKEPGTFPTSIEVVLLNN